MRILLILLLACCMGACSMPAAPLPDRATMAPPIDRLWPESTQQVTWTPGRSPQGAIWEISVGNDRVSVNDAQKKKYQKLIASDQVDTWKVQIHVWRSQLIHAQTWLHAQDYTPPQRLLSPRSAAAPHVWVFVSDQCQLCDQWKQHWPAHIPVTWVPVSQHALVDPLWAATWCPAPTLTSGSGNCAQQLHEQFRALNSLGVDTTPALIASDGRVLTGWPDGAWLSQWWSPSSVHWMAPAMVQEPDM